MKHTAILLPILLAGCTVPGVRSVDEPPFETVQVPENGIQIRHYAARVAAEAVAAQRLTGWWTTAGLAAGRRSPAPAARRTASLRCPT